MKYAMLSAISERHVAVIAGRNGYGFFAEALFMASNTATFSATARPCSVESKT